MSADGSAYVYRYSPYKGAVFQVHCALGDVANDAHGNEIYLSVGSLARKSRVSRRSAQTAIDTMIADGFLSLVEERAGGTNRYQFEFPPKPTVFDTRTRVSDLAADGRKVRKGCAPKPSKVRNLSLLGAQPEHEGAQSENSPHISKHKELKEQRAREIVKRVWEHKIPKPAQPFVAIVKIAQKLLDAGHDEHAIENAMLEVPTISTGWCEGVLNRRAKPRVADKLDMIAEHLNLKGTPDED